MQDKKLYKITQKGQTQLSNVVSSEQESVLASTLSLWEDKSNLELIEDICVEYPEYWT